MTTSLNTILLIEDNPNDVLLFQRAMENIPLNANVQIVSNGEEAIGFFEKQGDRHSANVLPQLILLDLKLPRRSGLEVLEWLKSHPRFRQLPVIILTTSQQNNDIRKAYNLGANSYLVKPVDFDQFEEMVKRIHTYWLEINQRPILN